MDFSTARNWRGRLVLEVPASFPGRGPEGMKAYGLWNRDALTLGAEGSFITDPEDGKVPTGGEQTAEDMAISRPYKRGRDGTIYRELRTLRGRARGLFHIHEVDNWGEPTSSTPLDTLVVVFMQVVLPGAEAGSSENSVMNGLLQVQP